jgi:hypothetical protein
MDLIFNNMSSFSSGMGSGKTIISRDVAKEKDVISLTLLKL